MEGWKYPLILGCKHPLFPQLVFRVLGFFLQFLTSYKFLSWTESVGISAVSGLEAVDVEQERPRVLRG